MKRKWVGIGIWAAGLLLSTGVTSYNAIKSGDVVSAVLAIAAGLTFGGMAMKLFCDKDF